MKDSRVDSETDSIAVTLAAFGGSNSLVEVGCIQLVLPDCLCAINAPGNNCLVIGLGCKQIVDVRAFRKQHQESIWEAREIVNEQRREVGNVVEGERIKHFAHIKTYFVKRACGKVGYLPEHYVVVDVNFYEGMVFAINKCKIAICAAIGTAVGDRNELVIRTTADSGTEFSVEFVYKRGCLANHQDSFAGSNRLTDRDINRRRESLMVDDFDRHGWKQINDSPGFGVLGGFSPKQNSIRCPVLSGIQN
jgi:hypothetical protein